ncbi:MAG: DUF1929 domain-containing protein [Bacteroidetes bacterium]|nr:DUF1929 domain-containing protein [Bacteroidota bacterium]
MEKGKWETYLNLNGCPLDSEQEAVHSCVIYDSDKDTWKVLFFDAYNLEQTDGEQSYIKTRILIMAGGADIDQITEQIVPFWPPPDNADEPRMFCSGHVFLDDGKLIVAGGHREPVVNNHWARGLKYTYIFDPITETWDYAKNPISGLAQPMHEGRWYPTLTKLEDNRVAVVGGFKYNYDRNGNVVYNDTVEVYTPLDGWTQLPPAANTPSDFIQNKVLYPGAHVIPYDNIYANVKAGHLLYTFPLRQTWRLNPNVNPGNDYWQPIAMSRHTRGNGSSVILPLKPNGEMKFVIFGGATGDMEMPETDIELLDLSFPTVSDSNPPAWQLHGSMNIPRRNANCVILPDGKIFITGGNQMHLRENGVTVAEMYNPETGECEIMPSTTFTRMYHSTAILLPDATVMASGGEYICSGGIGAGNNNFEIYTPEYLMQGGTRPIILSTGEREVSYTNTLYIDINTSINEVILISPGVPTHGFDQHQRAVYADFETLPPNGTHPYLVTMPLNKFIAPTGWYMLFVIKIINGVKVPSIAKFIRLIE